MMPAMWVSKTGLEAQDMALTTVSNNLANVSTTGFKRDRAVFQDLMYNIVRQPGAQTSEDSQLPSGLQLGSGVKINGTQKIFEEGSYIVTDQPLDLAINGRGFFQITLPDGNTSYSRDGKFHINSDGEVVTAQGFRLSPNIVVPEQAHTLTVGLDGTVSVVVGNDTQPTQVGTIETADFINPAGLEALGNNLFHETDASGAPQLGQAGNDGFGAIRQGMLENSNVSVVEEMVNMITVQRAYEMNSKVVSTADQMLSFLNQTL